MTEQTPKQPTQSEIEAEFRESLKDMATIAEHLAKFCLTPEEMIGMVELAIGNDAQLRLLMDLVSQKKR